MTLHPFNKMDLFRAFAISLALVFTFTGCGEPEQVRPVRGWAPIGTGDFDEVGKVSLFQGESCASQIVFVFHGAGSAPISMAAPFRVSKILTDAARSHKSVRVSGKWRHSKAPGCSYIEATQVAAVEKSFW